MITLVCISILLEVICVVIVCQECNSSEGDEVQRWRCWTVTDGVGGLLSMLLFFSVLELAVAASKTDPPDVLDRQKCLDALAEQRRSKWFQVCSF